MPAEPSPGAVSGLDDSWCAAVATCCAEAGRSAAVAAGDHTVTLQLLVTGPPRSGVEDALLLHIADEAVVGCRPARDAAADVTLALDATTFTDVLDGRLELPVAYMQGRCKASGDPAALLQLLSLSAQEHARQWIARVAAIPRTS